MGEPGEPGAVRTVRKVIFECPPGAGAPGGLKGPFDVIVNDTSKTSVEVREGKLLLGLPRIPENTIEFREVIRNHAARLGQLLSGCPRPPAVKEVILLAAEEARAKTVSRWVAEVKLTFQK
ncbi:MAG: hypothetical protein HY540_07905 [Deltaproteobacteria bacterium]|nr:hypothetical protein [Deltaproteobacteria bacterium]